MGLENLKNVLIAGGAGFIGSHLSKLLLDNEMQVTAVDNLLTGNEKNIDELKVNPNFIFIELDITKNLELLNKKFDIIFHLASPASPPCYFELPDETISANIDGTRNLIQLARRSSARLIYASTSEIYGDPLTTPQSEEYWGNVNPIGVRSIYDEAKRMGETLVSLARRQGLSAGIIRIFNTYGPNMDPFDGRVVSTFIRQAITKQPFTIQGSGDQTRSFCFVDDLVEGIMRFAMREDFGPVNLGNPQEITVNKLAEIISQVLGTQNEKIFSSALEDDPMQRKPDIDRALNLLGWTPNISLEEGIKLTAAWMRTQL